MKRKIIVRKETHQLSILTQPRLAERRFCDRCQSPVRWLIPEEAMILVNTSLREIFRLIESSEIHFVESPEGFLLVCAASLTIKKSK